MQIDDSIDQCDPFQAFIVQRELCQVLKVTVKEGHHISKGWVGDLMDTPDPYVILRVPGTPNGKKRTRNIDNNVSPKWNESFYFVLDPDRKNELEVILMDANYTIDEKLGSEKVDLCNLMLDEEKEITLTFSKLSEVVLVLLLTVDTSSDLRYSLALCDQEKEFRRRRRKIVLDKMAALLGDEGPASEAEVPTIGVLGSGGGFRALTSLSGSFRALSDTGILDCCTYVAGLSGSAWFLSTVYSHPDFPESTPAHMQEEIKHHVSYSPFWLLGPRSLYRYISSITEKYKSGQPVSFTDFFGHLLGDTLLKQRTECRLSDQQIKVDTGQVPMPLYTCLHVKSNVSARVFQDWIEFSPYEIGIAKYGTFMRTEHFGCKFYRGKIVKNYREFPLHYLQGVWGSAFCILFKRLIQGATKLSLEVNPSHDSSEDETDHSPGNEEDYFRDALENLDLDEDAGDQSHISDNEDDDDDDSFKDAETGDGTIQKSRETHGFWQTFINNICTSSILDTRKGRAGLILNPLRGLSLTACFPFSPFSPTCPDDEQWFKGLTEPVPTQSKTLYLVDGGLTFNLPFPLLLRPQRGVDIFLTFDFSSRERDESHPFKELLLSEQWARINSCPFPPVKELAAKFILEPQRECYIFRDPNDVTCPIIVHFPLVNKDFRKYSAPGIPRESEEDLQFGDFDVFSDPKNPFSIYNFKYSQQQFDRISKMMEFNVINNIPTILDVMKEVIKIKKGSSTNSTVILDNKPKRKFSSP